MKIWHEPNKASLFSDFYWSLLSASSHPSFDTCWEDETGARGVSSFFYTLDLNRAAPSLGIVLDLDELRRKLSDEDAFILHPSLSSCYEETGQVPFCYWWVVSKDSGREGLGALGSSKVLLKVKVESPPHKSQGRVRAPMPHFRWEFTHCKWWVEGRDLGGT
jgi:hypothetical protein